MKKTLLFVLALCIGFLGYSQLKVQPGVKTAKIPSPKEKTLIDEVAVKAIPSMHVSKAHKINKAYKSVDIVNIIPIGNSANSYGYGYNNGASTLIWADNNLNTIINTHRMTVPPNSGNLAIDISVDGGLTWEVNREIYNVVYEEFRARYPMGAIYNPEGNTDPNNAYVAYHAASLDGSNGGDWGSYTYGTASIGTPTDTTVHYLSSNLEEGFYQSIPTAFEITQQGDVWMADASLLDSYTEYMGDIIFMHGTWNEETTDYDMEEFLVAADCDYARYLKMAFSPDGQTGYVYWNNTDGSIPNLEDWSYPLLLKTTDGGETWDDELISIEVSGPDGIEGVKNWLSDEMLDDIFGAGTWDRDEILYYVPYFNSDIAVDADGNPHLACSIFLCADDPGYFIAEPYSFGVFDLFSMDGGETWLAQPLGALKTYEGNFPDADFPEFNRLQVASTMDGTMMFFTWLDTDLEGIELNNQPDVYARGFCTTDHSYTFNENGEDLPNNVTFLSAGMWSSFFQATSRYVFEDNNTYTIPIVYEDMEDPTNPEVPVQFMYISDFSYTYPNDFLGVGIGDEHAAPQTSSLQVNQSYPNPTNSSSTVKVTVDNAYPFYNVAGGTQDNYSLVGPSQNLSDHGVHSYEWLVTVTGDGFESAIDPENPNIVFIL